VNEPADRRLAGVKLTLPDKCRISAVDPLPTLVVGLSKLQVRIDLRTLLPVRPMEA